MTSVDRVNVTGRTSAVQISASLFSPPFQIAIVKLMILGLLKWVRSRVLD